MEARVTQGDVGSKVIGETSKICWDGFVKHLDA
jgi:hypothetical protein